MTKENRERQYKHFRDLEHNYIALPGRDHDLEKTDVLKKRAKASADAMLLKNPELEEKPKEATPDEKPKEQIKTKSKEKK